LTGFIVNEADEIACSFCGKRPGQVRRLFVGAGVDVTGNMYRGTLCSECLSTFMLVMAAEDRQWFDREVDEARKFTPGQT